MNGRVIEHILTSDPYTRTAYKGFNTFDIPLKKKFSRPAIIILNTDYEDGVGEHWCVANFVNNDICEFFDSYGQQPCFYHFDKIIYKQCEKIVSNPFCVQGFSNVCGHHCLFYVLHRYWGYDDVFILNMYSKTDLLSNDRMVYEFIAKNYGETCAGIENKRSLYSEKHMKRDDRDRRVYNFLARAENKKHLW